MCCGVFSTSTRIVHFVLACLTCFELLCCIATLGAKIGEVRNMGCGQCLGVASNTLHTEHERRGGATWSTSLFLSLFMIRFWGLYLSSSFQNQLFRLFRHLFHGVLLRIPHYSPADTLHFACRERTTDAPNTHPRAKPYQLQSCKECGMKDR